MTFPLGQNRYGKTGIRLATVTRGGDRHHLTDLELDVLLEGAFDAAHTEGDNTVMLPADTLRGTCTALAQGGIEHVAVYLQTVAERLLLASPATDRIRMRAVAFPWERLEVGGEPHTHGFRSGAGGTAVTILEQQRGAPPAITGGTQGLRLLKTTGSAFSGYPIDAFTTLPETRDRILAATVEASWGTTEADLDHTTLGRTVPATFSETFATHDTSESLQHTLYAMGTAVLDVHPEVTWIRFRMPSEHHALADLSPYGLDNPNVVYVVVDDPTGLIEGVVAREGVAPPPAW